MTEIALREQHIDPPSDPTGGRLVAWATGMQAAHKLGSALCSTAFAPQHFRGKPDEAAAAIMYGDEIGFTPTQALQNIYVISGKPALYARAMVALVLAKGHEVWTVEKSPAKVTVAGRRKGSAHVHEETWTTARAQKAGYTNNKKYDTDPEAMLYARAASDVCRQIAPDALAGLAYSAEELELSEAGETRTVRREGSQTVRRQPKAPMPEPEVEPEPIGEVTVEPPAEAVVTKPQLTKIGACMTDLGITDRTLALQYVARVVGREVGSRNELTKSEAHALIEALEADLRDEGGDPS